MATSIHYHTQGIRGFHHKKTERKDGTEYYHLVSTASKPSCPCCASKDVEIVSTAEERSVRGLPIGLKKRSSRSRSDVFAAEPARPSPESA